MLSNLIMELKEALKRAADEPKVKEMEKKGYFLNSGTCIMPANDQETKEWIISYYSPSDNKVFTVSVGASTRVGEPADPNRPSTEKLDIGKLEADAKTVLQNATKEFITYGHPLSQTIMNVQNSGWTVNFITRTLQLVSVTVGTKEGKVTGSKIESLTREA